MRQRARYLAVGVATMLVGLAVHWYGDPLSARARDWTGDALWAFMVAAGVSTLMPMTTRVTRALLSYGICVAVECSQLLHTPLLDQIRSTTLGHLVLGNGFDVRDLGAYLCGVALFALIDRWFRA